MGSPGSRAVLVDLRDAAPGVGVRVVVNRMRPTLGWSHADITGMVEGYVRPLGVHFLPEDRAAVDRSVVDGKALSESVESPLRQAVAELSAAVFGTAGPGAGQAPKSR